MRTGEELYEYVADSPTNAIDPSGLFSVTRVTPGFADKSEGDGFPRGKTVGANWRIQRESTDGNYFSQNVAVSGSLLCHTANGDYHYVWFEYNWIEVWKFLEELDFHFYDPHLNGPSDPADFLDRVCDCPCDWEKPWYFAATAKFTGRTGSVSPDFDRFARTPVSAATTFRCAGQRDEGETVGPPYAIVSMYPKEGTVLDPFILYPLSASQSSVDRFVCSGDGGHWKCHYTSTGYH